MGIIRLMPKMCTDIVYVNCVRYEKPGAGYAAQELVRTSTASAMRSRGAQFVPHNSWTMPRCTRTSPLRQLILYFADIPLSAPGGMVVADYQQPQCRRKVPLGARMSDRTHKVDGAAERATLPEV